VLFDVLAVVALAAGEAEEALAVVGEAEQAVLAPAVGPRPGVVVGEGVPRLAVGRIVFPNGAPLALRGGRAPGRPTGVGGIGPTVGGCRFAHSGDFAPY